MWGFGAGAKIIEKIGKIVFQVMNSANLPSAVQAFSSASTFPMAGVKRSLRPLQGKLPLNLSSYQNYLPWRPSGLSPTSSTFKHEQTSKDCQTSEESLCEICNICGRTTHSIMGARSIESSFSLPQSIIKICLPHLLNIPRATHFSPSPLSTLLVVWVTSISHSNTYSIPPFSPEKLITPLIQLKTFNDSTNAFRKKSI